MRKLLVIVLLSYSASYSYLNINFWDNPRQFNNAAYVIKETKEVQSRVNKASQEIYANYEKPADVILLPAQ